VQFFDVFFVIFGLFSVGPLWKRLNSAIFRTFLLFFGLIFCCPHSLEIFLPKPLTLWCCISSKEPFIKTSAVKKGLSIANVFQTGGRQNVL